MRKIIKQLMSLVLCAALLWCMVPAVRVSAAVEKNGDITFSSFEGLQELAKDTYVGLTHASYAGEGPLEISADLTLPDYLCVDARGSQLTVSAGVTLTATSQKYNSYIYADSVTVEGTFTCDFLEVTDALTVTGKLYNNNTIYLKDTTVVTGADQIVPAQDWSEIHCFCTVTTMTALQEAVAEAKAAPDDSWRYFLMLDQQDVLIDESVSVPGNCEFEVNSMAEDVTVTVAAGCTLDLDCYTGIYSSLVVDGTLINRQAAEVFYDFGGSMMIADEGDYVSFGTLYVYSDELTDPEEAVPGLDLADFDVYENSDFMTCWELTHQCIHTAQNYAGVVTAPTCTQKGYTTYTCLECGDSYVDDYTALQSHNFEDTVCTGCGSIGGTCGEDALWSYDAKTKTLTISGSGAMYDYSYMDPTMPWKKYADEVTSVVIGKGITSVGSYAFYACSTLKEVEIADSVTDIGSYAFAYCSSLTGISLPGSVDSIGNYAFRNCSALKNVTFADGITGIGSWAFTECGGLTEIDLPDTVTGLGDGAFYGCSSLKSAEIPAGVTVVGKYTFSNCGSLTEVEIHDGVMDIGSRAFANCGSLTKITIPASVEHIGSLAFSDCVSLKEITFEGNPPQFDKNYASGGYVNQNFLNVTAEVNYPTDNPAWTSDVRQNYGGTLSWSTCVNGHTEVVDQAVDATCTESGLTEGKHCSVCSAILTEQEEIPAKGHDYQSTQTAPTCGQEGYTAHTCSTCGDHYKDDYMDATGDHTYQDEKDATCDVCGYTRTIETKVETTPMYRLYNPNSGEHFYTGSVEEREILMEAGWNYEGVSWNAPIKGGTPVHRVYNPNSGDHHYTMDQKEVDMLVNAGWQYEGVAWNSASSDNVPLFRLWNPNADCGSHHYTSSEEERDILVDAGWILEGIGWYGMLK